MKKTLGFLGIIAVAAVIGFGFTGCEDGSGTGGGGCDCVWGSWEETQAATYVSEGVETRTKVCEVLFISLTEPNIITIYELFNSYI